MQDKDLHLHLRTLMPLRGIMPLPISVQTGNLLAGKPMQINPLLGNRLGGTVESSITVNASGA